MWPAPSGRQTCGAFDAHCLPWPRSAGGGSRLGQPPQQVFTPPRDDPSTLPRFAQSPRWLDDSGVGAEHPARAATLQACGITATTFCAVLLVTVAGCGLYATVSAVLGKELFVDCKEQLIQNGALKGGLLNNSAVLHCDLGFVLRRAQGPELACRLVYEKCLVYKRATEVDNQMLRCEREYAFAARSADAVRMQDNSTAEEVQRHVAALQTAAYEQTVGFCVLDTMLRVNKLFGLHAGSPSASSGASGDPTSVWSPTTSLASLLFLATVSLFAVVSSGVSRGSRVQHQNAAEWESVALLEDTSDEERLPSAMGLLR